MIPEATLAHLRTGGTVAYPTTTLPGLACLPMASALDGLYALKRRSADKPVSLAVLDLEQASRLVKVPPIVAELEAAFPKGGITFVLDALQPLDPGWAVAGWPFGAWLIPLHVHLWKRWVPSRPPAPTKPVKFPSPPPRRLERVLACHLRPCSKAHAPGASAPPSLAFQKVLTGWR